MAGTHQLLAVGDVPDGGRLLQHARLSAGDRFRSGRRVRTALATVVLVLVTLFGALPVYAHVAGARHSGQGSIAMLERLVQGWTGKTMVLALLGFAATDFVITMTLSAADASVHLIRKSALAGHAPLDPSRPATTDSGSD